MEANPTDVDSTFHRWMSMVKQVLLAVVLPDNISPAPEAILGMIKCGCSSTSSCSKKRNSCSSANDAYSIMWSCGGSPDVCYNKETRSLASAEGEVLTDRNKDGDNDKDEDE